MFHVVASGSWNLDEFLPGDALVASGSIAWGLRDVDEDVDEDTVQVILTGAPSLIVARDKSPMWGGGYLHAMIILSADCQILFIIRTSID